MSRTLLITGATGNVSTALLDALKDSDLRLRALIRDDSKAATVRDRGAHVHIGDLDDARSLPPAFDGVDDVWLLPPNGPRSSENSMNALWAARQAGVQRVVRLSAVRAAHDAPTRSGRLHALSDHELQASGMNWTILRPHWFMQNLINESGDIAANGTFSLNAADARLGMIDVRDIAELAAQVLTDPPEHHHGKVYTPTGPRSISFAEVARQISRVLGRTVDYIPNPDETERAALLSAGVPAWIADMLIEYGQAYSAGWGDFTTSDYQDVVGHSPRDVADFIRDHAAAFTSADDA